MTDFSLLILTQKDFSSNLRTILNVISPNTNVYEADSLETLEARSAGLRTPSRLIAFCTDIFVPPSILNRFERGAYNFHPGPPAYPGIFPSCFAIYDGAKEFGSTAHLMTEQIDTGEIVGTNSFTVPENVDRFTLDQLSYKSVIELFETLAPKLVDGSAELERSDKSWLGPVRTRKNFNALCEMPDDIDEDEFNRRYRAVGEGPHHALSFTRFGHRFSLNNVREDDAVYQGGTQTA